MGEIPHLPWAIFVKVKITEKLRQKRNNKVKNEESRGNIRKVIEKDQNSYSNLRLLPKIVRIPTIGLVI